MGEADLHLVGFLSLAVNALAGFAAVMVRGRLKDKDKEIGRLTHRIEELESDRDEHYAAHYESAPPHGS
jgi:hypothetical protein